MNTDYIFPLQVAEKGAELGYAPHKLPLLFLVPFVQAGERKTILRFAKNLSVNADHSDYERLVGWFDERPPDEFFVRSIEDLRELLEGIPANQTARLRSMLQFGCVEVARAARLDAEPRLASIRQIEKRVGRLLLETSAATVKADAHLLLHSFEENRR